MYIRYKETPMTFKMAMTTRTVAVTASEWNRLADQVLVATLGSHRQRVGLLWSFLQEHLFSDVLKTMTATASGFQCQDAIGKCELFRSLPSSELNT